MSRWKLLLFSLLFTECLSHPLFGGWAVLRPLMMKWRYHADITVPVFQNGLVVADAPALNAEEKHRLIPLARKTASLFWNGFTLNDFNQDYARLRSYRLTLQIYGANPYVPFVRHPGVVLEFDDGEGLHKSIIADENGYLVFEPPFSEKGAYTILTLGASTTSSPYPFYLWRYLNKKGTDKNYRVVNAGLPFYTSAEMLATFAFRGVDYHPDLVIFYEANNDMFPAYGRDYRSDYSHWRRTYDDALMHRAAFFDYLPRYLDFVSVFSIIRNAILWPALRPLRYGLAGLTSNYFPQLTEADQFHKPDAYRRNLESLLGLTKVHGSQLLLVTQLHQPKFSTPAAYAFSETLNETMREVGKYHRQDLSLYDFEKAYKSRVNELMVRDNVHFDEAGYRILGEAIGQFILHHEFPHAR